MRKLAETDLQTKYGTFKEVYFSLNTQYAIALIKGDINNRHNLLTRIHSSCLSSHTFNSVECDCQLQMDNAQELISKEGVGLIIWLDQEGRSNGHLAKMLSNKYKKEGYSQNKAFSLLGCGGDVREYSFAVSILHFYEVKSIKLITNNLAKINAVLNGGIDISKYIEAPIQNEKVIENNIRN